LSTATVTSKGQITIPKDIRDELELQTGDRIDFVTENGRLFLVPKTIDVRVLKGIVKYDGAPVSLEDMERGIVAGITDRVLGQS